MKGKSGYWWDEFGNYQTPRMMDNLDKISYENLNSLRASTIRLDKLQLDFYSNVKENLRDMRLNRLMK